ncbi:hypothetical protein [Novosphingopyxis sp. YJ-S2-01]|uniref:hypothetical protein n=1 Tax=Novosphingopyxis sp. YJ-S2-01 TaxID=2794021 RepID=UPI0018DBE63E|nr:hypothetical protein [Novosphingopyxis sp. YJ-S2-01]MBH9537890.1 hypothetical protein [Novosphingopyxis sp. YJ-S2-01]
MIEVAGFGVKLAGARSALIAIACTAALCLPTAYCKGRDDGAAKAEAARAVANVEALEADAVAAGAAAEERLADALRIDDKEEELIDAIAELPDAAPDPVRVRLGCERLRAQGTPEADLSALCGS